MKKNLIFLLLLCTCNVFVNATNSSRKEFFSVVEKFDKKISTSGVNEYLVIANEKSTFVTLNLVSGTVKKGDILLGKISKNGNFRLKNKNTGNTILVNIESDWEKSATDCIFYLQLKQKLKGLTPNNHR